MQSEIPLTAVCIGLLRYSIAENNSPNTRDKSTLLISSKINICGSLTLPASSVVSVSAFALSIISNSCPFTATVSEPLLVAFNW